MRKIIAFILLIYLVFNVSAQDTTVQNIEAKTYELYLNKDWHKLIKITKKAIENGTDYYYLRMRIGIAYYEQRRYNLAIKQFEKAQQFDENDILNEYLYRAYLYSGNIAEAEQLAETFNKDLKQKLQIKPQKKVLFAGFTYGTIINTDYNKLYDLQIEQTNQYTLNNRFRDELNQYFALDVKFRFNRNLSSLVSYGKLYEPKTQIIRYHYLDTEEITTEIHSNKTTQTNLYFNLDYKSQKINWNIALNFINVKDNYFIFQEGFPIYSKKEVDEKYTNAILFAGIESNFDFTSIGFNASISGLGVNRQIQLGASLKLYPKANKNFVIYAMPTYQNISKSVFVQGTGRRGGYYERVNVEDNFVLKTGIITMPLKNIFVDINAYFGRLNQFNDNLAYLVFNDVDPITTFYSAKLSYKHKKFTVFVTYSFSEKEHEYQIIDYLQPPVIEDVKKNININNQSIFGGVLWNF